MFLDFVKDEIATIREIETKKNRIWSLDNFKDFVRRAQHAVRLVLEEKEILIFALFQWIFVCLGYQLWVQILGWIPDSVWGNEEKMRDIALNLLFIGWSFVCVGIVAAPIAILTGCIGATHFLRKQGFPSDIASCLRLVLPRAWSLWIYQWADAWITVNQILKRLPKKNDHESSGSKALSELIYYAWKIGTVGILPSLLNGKNLFIAGKEAVLLVKSRPMDVMMLRGGYSLFCWIIGVLSYMGAIVLAFFNPHVFEAKNYIYHFYVMMGVPIFISVGIIQLILRPIFVLSSCELYTDYVVTEKLDASYSVKPSKIISFGVVFALLLSLVGVVYLFRGPLGISEILEVRSEKYSFLKEKWQERAEKEKAASAEFQQEQMTAEQEQGYAGEDPANSAPAQIGAVAGSAKSKDCDPSLIRVEGDKIVNPCE